MEHYKIESTAPPAPTRAQWKDKLTSLKIGDWFIAPKEDHSRLVAAGNNYLRGKHSLYKINENDYCFIRRA
jgi:hypothetical protein